MHQIHHNRLTVGDLEAEAIAETVRRGHWACGPKVATLEETLARMAGVKHAVCVGSGVAALRIALQGLGVQSGDRVWVPAYSCVALANAVLASAAAPLPVDITSGDWNLSIEAAGALRSVGSPKAAIVVNTFGTPAALGPLRDLGIPVIEDCAHAFGISAEDGPLGGRSDAAILSFYATKLIGAGEGGAILTNSDALAAHARQWRDYSDQPPDGTKLNDKMTDLAATLALCQLERLPAMIATRQALAVRYHERLASLPLRLPDIEGKRIWYRYAVDTWETPVDDLIRHLSEQGIGSARPVTDWRPANSPEAPVASYAYDHLLSLPLYPTLTDAEQDCVIAAVRGYFQK